MNNGRAASSRGRRIPNGEKAVEALVILKERTMLDHIILTVSNVERSLAFYEAALKPRARVEYYPGYYAADIFDPDGYSFEVVHKS